MAKGAAGTVSKVLLSFIALFRLGPQSEVYNNLTLSPVAAAALLVYLTTRYLELVEPESIIPVKPSPVKDHE